MPYTSREVEWSDSGRIVTLLTSPLVFNLGLLKKATSGVLAIFPCSRIASTLRAKNLLYPCWSDFFEPTRDLWHWMCCWTLWALYIITIQLSQL